jgi:hypothetical protein
MLSSLRRAGLGLLLAAAAGAQASTTGPKQPAANGKRQPKAGVQRQTTTHSRRASLPRSVLPGPPPGMLHMPGSEVEVSLLTMGNGNQVWELFGHTAILIRDDRSGRDTVMNWGEFDLHEPNFIPHFLKGLNRYQMGGQTFDSLISQYTYLNRSVTEQDLNLTTTEKDSLLAMIARNAMPDSITYAYDYFVDNCATKPRDILDRVLGGRLYRATNISSGHSFRWHTLRLMGGNRPLVIGSDIGLGEPSDTTITRWGEMFLPKQLHDNLNTLQATDTTGGRHPLVARGTVLLQSTRGPEAAAPPPLGVWLLVLGLVLAAIIAGLGALVTRSERPRRALTVAAAVVLGAWTFVAGILGVLLTLLWTITDHRYAYSNENLLLFNPLWLILVVLVILSVTTGRAWRWTRDLAVLVTTLAVVALLAHVVGASRQVNLPVIWLALPPALALVWVGMRGAALGPRPRSVASA